MSHKEKKATRYRVSKCAAWLTTATTLGFFHNVVAQEVPATELPQLPGTTRAAWVPGHLTLAASAEYTDNVTRAPSDPIRDTIYGLGSDFQWRTRGGGRVDARIDGDLSYYRYTKADYQPDVVGGVAGNLSYSIVPDFFYWQIQDSFRQVRIDYTAPVTPNNRQNTNLFATGPRLQIPLGDRRTLLTIDGQYEHSSYSVSAQDSNVLLGRMAILRRIGANSSLSLSADAREVKYDSRALFPSYKAQDYLVNWTALGSRTSVALDAGYSYTQQDNRDAGSPYFQLALSRSLTPRTSISLYGNHRLTGSSDAVHFSQMGAGSGPRTSEFAVNPDPFTLQQLGLTYAFTSTRSSIDLGASVQRDRYQTSSLDDRNIVNTRLQAWTMLSPVWSIGVFGGYSRETFTERNNAQSTLSNYGLFAGARIATRLRIEVSASHDARNTNFGGFDYDENAVRATLAYTFGQEGYSSGMSMPRSNR